jgi:hypothetical protein
MKRTTTHITTRRELYDFLQSQMHSAYDELRETQRLPSESTLVKSYIVEVDTRHNHGGLERVEDLANHVFRPPGLSKEALNVQQLDENGFLRLELKHREQLVLYLDAGTNSRFWLGFSLSSSKDLDWWLESCIRATAELDFVWMWPGLLKKTQERGEPRGFGLDYDYRKFESDDEATTYLKMQLWGGSDTQELYDLIRKNKRFRDKAVLSKVRLKEYADTQSHEAFALQDIKYTGKFTTRGTDFATHVRTLSDVRQQYAGVIEHIEEACSLRWKNEASTAPAFEGSAIHFEPIGAEVPVRVVSERVLDGTAPFRLLGLVEDAGDETADIEAVDLHTGGTVSIEMSPERISMYLPEGTCGNTVARFYTNLQHFFNVRFNVLTDNDETLFQPASA